MSFTFQPMDATSARDISSWRYEAPYDVYDPAPDGAVEPIVQSFLEPQNAYYTITDPHGELAAYCCFGPDARVRGGDYRSAALDIGMGLRPDLTGQGRGSVYVSAVLDFARRTFAPAAFRVTVATFNQRALRVWEKAGFQRVQTFHRQRDNRAFVILSCEA
jgi:ribosomal-protein-alanine N-acetyltransferase